jgi:hypothetical protein
VTGDFDSSFTIAATGAFQSGFEQEAGGFAAAVADTALDAKVPTSRSFNDILIKVSGSCTLQGANGTLEIGVDLPFENIKGATAQYAAVYAVPMIGEDIVGAPQRLCARGSGLVFSDFEFGASALVEQGTLEFDDIGGTYAFQWVVPNVSGGGCQSGGWGANCFGGFLNKTDLSVKFFVVAGVAAQQTENFEFLDAQVLGVAARAKLKDCNAHFEAKNLTIVNMDGEMPE